VLLTASARTLRRNLAVATLGVLALALPAGISASGVSAPLRQIDLSRAHGAQTEASIAVDPSDPKVLLAASQDGYACALRIYSSDDAGRSWRSTAFSTPGAELTRRDPAWRGHLCAGNEWVGVDATGGQYVAFVAGDVALSPRGYTLFVASRQSDRTRWRTAAQVDPSKAGLDDKPMLLVDTSPSSPHRGRLYVAWSRSVNSEVRTVLLAHSDDGGGSWSMPEQIGEGWGVHLALARDGVLFASWWGSDGYLAVNRSTDGGDHFGSPRRFLSLLRYYGFGVAFIPAMRREVVHPNPALDADRSNGRYGGRVYAASSVPGPHGREISVTAFTPKLGRLLTRQIALPHARRARDEFNPALAVDQSSGTVWLCFYLTGASAQRALATYSCTTSRDGGSRWGAIRAVATVPSNEAQAGGFRTPSGVDNEYASYEGLAVQDGVAHPVWTDTRNLRRLREEIYSTRVTP
jgi:hypothetical protein